MLPRFLKGVILSRSGGGCVSVVVWLILKRGWLPLSLVKK